MTCALCLGTFKHVADACICNQPIGVRSAHGIRSADGSVSHALVFGSSLADLRLWCGKGSDDVSKHDYIAGKPEVVTCSECIRKMQTAHTQLVEWVPRLKVET